MSAPALVLFDDDVARDWRPFTLTRPAGELLFGTRTLRERAEHALGLSCVGHIAADHLAEYDESWAPPVVERGAPGDVVLLLSRLVVEPATLPEGPALLTVDGQVVGCRLAAGSARPDARFFRQPDRAAPDLPRHELPGSLIGSLWELMAGSASRAARDLADGVSPLGPPSHRDAPELPGVHVLGEGPLLVGEGVRIGPNVVLDTRAGPIGFADGVQVLPFSHVVGPAWVGRGSTLLGGPYEAVSIGPVCKVHGEIEETVVLGYSNKAHDGFLGHAYLGMWVNLGALTTNSDLKNNYGSVRLWTPGGEVDTGERKVGCFLGDHVKTAIGTMINTGTVIEAGSNVFGGMPAKYVPPFSWGDPATSHEADRFLATAATVLSRRDVVLSDRQRSMLRAAWRKGREPNG